VNTAHLERRFGDALENISNNETGYSELFLTEADYLSSPVSISG